MTSESNFYFNCREILSTRSIRIVELEDGPNSRGLRHEIEVLRMEQNTWGLLQAIMPFVYTTLIYS